MAYKASIKYGYADKKAPLARRLSRIEGQVRGVSKMVDGDKYCIDILTQITAAQSALDRVALELLAEHTRHCMDNEQVGQDKNQKVDELVKAVGRMI